MKINFFRTIWWKILLSYILVIFITMIAFSFITSLSVRRFSEIQMQRDMEGRMEKVAMLIQKYTPKGGSLSDSNNKLSEIALLSDMPLNLLDTNGKIVAFYWSRRRPPFNEMKEIHFTPEEMLCLKKGEKFSKIAHVGPEKHRLLCAAYPIKKDGEFIGSVMTTMPFGPPWEAKEMIFKSILLSTLISSFLALIISRNITNPIRRMEKAAKGIMHGDFSQKINLVQNDELGYLARAFDEMSENIQSNIKSRMRLMRDISHEINTPLAAARAIAEALNDGMFDTQENTKKNTESMLNQIRRLSFLVDDITDLSKFEAGELKIEKIAIKIPELIQNTLESARISAQNSDATISYSIEDENIEALGDCDRLEQVLINLIQNAIQHNKPGITVLVKVCKEDNNAVFSVEDNGQGIPKDEIENIFNRFHKVDKSRTRGESGSGLGLAIVKEIILAHGSDIFAESSPEGTKFRFSLPLA